jgi:hypothetical protein
LPTLKKIFADSLRLAFLADEEIYLSLNDYFPAIKSNNDLLMALFGSKLIQGQLLLKVLFWYCNMHTLFAVLKNDHGFLQVDNFFGKLEIDRKERVIWKLYIHCFLQKVFSRRHF